jgi:hypothetical protein
MCKSTTFLFLLFCYKLINISFQIFPLLVSEISKSLCRTMLRYLRDFGLDPLTTAFWPDSFNIKLVNILHLTTVYAASVRTDLDSHQLTFSRLFSQALCMSSIPFKFSKVAKLFDILI